MITLYTQKSVGNSVGYDNNNTKGLYMKKTLLTISALISALLTLSSCDTIKADTISMSTIYIITTALSLLLLIGYCTLLKKKDTWFISLFASVFIVNAGYLSLSLSTSTQEALLANRISYLGSVMLPLAMIMIIKNSCKIKYNKLIISLLIATSIIVYLIAASPGFLDIYYASVTLKTINGVSILIKEYGPLHNVYMFYLLGYFSIMIGTIIFAVIKKKINRAVKVTLLALAVLINILVWMIEKIISVDFEFLSVSYIISELFFLSIYLIEQENEFINTKPAHKENADFTDSKAESQINSEQIERIEDTEKALTEQHKYFLNQLDTLTTTEKTIYNLHVEAKSTKEILDELNIKENTLKFHNRNIYSKLGVSSKKELRKIALEIKEINK